MLPVSSWLSFSTTRWIVVSMLCHTTVAPGGTVAGFGENDWLPFSLTTLIVIASAGGGLPGPVVDELPYPPHAATPTVKAASPVANKRLRIVFTF
jgi:hypothetical protein